MLYTEIHTALQIEDYPLGGRKRGIARYRVTTEPRQGKLQRVERTTEHNNQVSKARKLTYGKRAAILVGADGRVYPVVWSQHYEVFSVYKSNMQHSEETISKDEKPNEYANMKARSESMAE
jgi:hypothetical protein